MRMNQMATYGWTQNGCVNEWLYMHSRTVVACARTYQKPCGLYVAEPLWLMAAPAMTIRSRTLACHSPNASASYVAEPLWLIAKPLLEAHSRTIVAYSRTLVPHS